MPILAPMSSAGKTSSSICFYCLHFFFFNINASLQFIYLFWETTVKHMFSSSLLWLLALFFLLLWENICWWLTFAMCLSSCRTCSTNTGCANTCVLWFVSVPSRSLYCHLPISGNCFELFELLYLVENGRILIITLLTINPRTSQEFDFLN